MKQYLDFKPKEFMQGSSFTKLQDHYKSIRLLTESQYYITVDNSKANSHNINIDRPHFFCFAINEAEAVGQMMLSNFEYKHLPIVSITIKN